MSNSANSEPKSDNIKVTKGKIDRTTRAALQGGPFRGCTIWLTGLSGSGKTTIAYATEEYLVKRNINAYVLDGDNTRSCLNEDLGWSPEDCEENSRRLSKVAKLFADAGLVCLVSVISPCRAYRDKARRLHTEAELPFCETFIGTPVAECERRDVKGLYKKFRAGTIEGMPGLDEDYEEPVNPELTIPTVGQTVDESVDQIIKYLESLNIVEKS